MDVEPSDEVVAETKKVVEVPYRYPTSTIYTDDSGVKSELLVVGGIKVRRHGALLRGIRHVRDVTGFEGEFKFTQLNKGSVSAYYAMIEELQKSDAHLLACVTRRPSSADWRFYAEVTTRVVRGNVNRRELVGLLMDTVSTPQGIGLDDVVRGKVNKSFNATSVVSAASLDSRSSDGLQVADLVAGAVAFDRKMRSGEGGKSTSIKGRVVARLMEAFEVSSFEDIRTPRVNVHTWTTEPPLKVVPAAS